MVPHTHTHTQDNSTTQRFVHYTLDPARLSSELLNVLECEEQNTPPNECTSISVILGSLTRSHTHTHRFSQIILFPRHTAKLSFVLVTVFGFSGNILVISDHIQWDIHPAFDGENSLLDDHQ
jgi:hypothetical protein